MGNNEITLRQILAAEGTYSSCSEIPSDILHAAYLKEYEDGLSAVVAVYKTAARLRKKVDGLNFNPDSVAMFRTFARSCENIPHEDMSAVVCALYVHNAASAFANGNGNLPQRQRELNEEALGILNLVLADQRDDDWAVVWEKVVVGLMEAGHMEFDEEKYRQLIASMERGRSKDTAGRKLFYAKWLAKNGRGMEAIDLLTPVRNDTFSAPNQVKEALDWLSGLSDLI